MAASKLLLVLLSMALLTLTSAQRADEDDENSLQGQLNNFHAGLKEMKSLVKEQISQHGKMAENLIKGSEKSNKGKGRGGNRGSGGEGSRGQDRQSGNQQESSGQGGRGRGGQKGGKGQNAKGGQKTQRGKGGKRNQKENGGELSEE
ncbi:H/ACA ribonucleoprotein complex subunit 1-like [Mesocricetus auratus]|uniref:H/ACA ribonucleoprotein complex subunit 1-like n=1 Tax=Mesocricetus auratus TaxID=10036 RepID=A0ABM2X9W9_MESAU|nr:H/ACA ribonucleoprotein complex subunit 1-like [Mesocricetus auratus]